MASQGPNYVGTCVNDAANFGDVAWSNPSNVVSGSAATCAVDPMDVGAISQYLKATNFGFSIPSGATINGITVEIEKKTTTVTGSVDDEVLLVIGGATAGSNKAAAAWGTSYAYETYGGSADLWGTTPSVAQVNASDFGVVLSAKNFTLATTFSVDHVRITLTYTAGGGTYTTSPTGSVTASGVLRRAVSKPAAGSSASAGSLRKAAAKPAAGSSTASGSLANVKSTLLSLTGSITASASLARAISKAAAGSCTASGAETHAASKPLAGSSAAAGSLAKSAAKPSAGSITASGSESNATAKAASGSTTPSGGLAKSVSVSAAGSTAPSGAESSTTSKGITGATTATGGTSNAVGKSAAGETTPAGSLANATGKALSGSSTPSGAFAGVKSTLLAVSGAVTAAGSLVRSVAKYLVGLVIGDGSLSTDGGTPAPVVAKPGGTFKRPPASRIFTRPPAGRVLKRPATVASRIFSRRAGTARIFARHPTTAGRIFKGYPRMAAILITKLPIDTNETRAFIFDFSQFDEAKAGETLDSATVPAVSGVTIGTPAVLTEDTNFVPSGLGVKVNLGVATAGATYDIECRGVFSGGSTCVVKGQLVGE